MPLGVSLVQLRKDLRVETGQTLNIAMGVQAQANQDLQLERQQRELWDQYEWQHLKYWRDVAASAHQALYSYPDDMPFDQIKRIWWSDGTSKWRQLKYGLHAFDIPLGAMPVGTPQRWGNQVTVTSGKTDPAGQMLLLPAPQGAGILRFEGQAPLNPLIADDDECMIDSTAIVLFAASEILATQKVEAAQMKLIKAQNYLRSILRAQGADKRANYNMGGQNRRVDTYGSSSLPMKNQQAAVPGIDFIEG